MRTPIILFVALFAILVAEPIIGENYREGQKKSLFPLGYYPYDPLPRRTVYLTFDDGPAEWTVDILDVLKKHNVKATFFITGGYHTKTGEVANRFLKYRDTLKRIVDEGHVIGNHSAMHRKFNRMSGEKITADLVQNQEFLYDALGVYTPNMTLIRPPWGYPWKNGGTSEEMLKAGTAIEKKGLLILWTEHFNSGDSMEWVKGDWYEDGVKVEISQEEFQKKMDQIYRRLILKSQGQGMVVLFHDTHLTSVKILPKIIAELKKRDYTFATMEDYVRWKWGMSSLEILRSRENR